MTPCHGHLCPVVLWQFSMAEEQVETFEAVSSGASDTIPMQCSSIKKNGYAVMKGRPCKVVDTSTSKTGKHGHAKVHMVGIDIFSGRKYEEICPSTHNMDVPNVKRAEYPLLAISDDGFVSLLLPTGETKDDLKLPDGDLGQQIRTYVDEGKELTVSVLAAMGEEAVVAAKEAAK